VGKPSIFSKEYEKYKKRRRIKITVTIIIFIILFGVLFALKGNLKNILINNNQKNTDETEKNNKEIVSSQQKENTKNTNIENINIENANTEEKTSKDEIEEKSYDITLDNGIKLKAVYEYSEGTNKFKHISTDNPNISFNLNPSNTGIVIFDGISQGIWFINIDGKVENISDLSYKSYKRDTVLKKRPNYVWCTLPKFIDDENIAYFSQLPYIRNSATKYLWTVNVKNKNSHKSKTSIKGENLKFGDIQDKGLEIIMDNGTSKFVKVNNGNIIISQ
jgi:cell division protein FtsB